MDTVSAIAAAHAEKRAVHDFQLGRSFSYREVDALIALAADELRTRLGNTGGQRVAVLARNGIEQLVLLYACLRSSAIFVPLNWRLSATELRSLTDSCEPALLYFQSEFKDRLAQWQGARQPLEGQWLNTTATRAETRAAIGTDSAHAACAPIPAEQIAILLYTSGTTGNPKGVILTAGNVQASTENFRAVAHVRADSVLLCDSPLFHTMGLIAITCTTMAAGGTLLLSPAFAASETVERIANPSLGITHYFCVPQMAQLLRQAPNFQPEPFRRLRGLFVGGAPVPAALAAAWLGDGVRFINGYGMSEGGTAIHMPLEHGATLLEKPNSIGLPAPLMEASLRNPDGMSVKPGEVGEIWVRGPSVSRGYWGLPAETTAAFVDGWYRSGDAARQDADGYYYIVDRWKDMYISGGENVFPAEVERVIAALPGVAEVAVVGQPDVQWGEVGEAYVIVQPGTALTEAVVVQHCRAQLAAYKAPKRVQFVSDFPRTGSGKIKKAALRRPTAPS